MISAAEFLKYCYVFKVFDQSGGGGGTVTAVGSGTGLTGGPINTSGTLSFAPIAANSLWANNTGGSAVPQVIPFSTLANALGFGTMATQNANAVNITGGTANLTTLRAPLNAVAMTTNTNLAANPQRDLYVASSASVITLTDPAGLATYAAGTSFQLKNNGSTQNVVFQPFGSETVNGQASFTVAPGECYQFAKNTAGTNWVVISSYGVVPPAVSPFLNSVYAISTTTLSGWSYYNGPNNDGVGATLTAPSNGVFSFDGVAPSVGQRVLYRNGGAQNGVYIVTVSSAGAPAVLTRAPDNNSPSNMLANRGYFVTHGTAWGGSTLVQENDVTEVGTTVVSYSAQFLTSTYLNRSGGSMFGTLDMNNEAITNVPTPVSGGDAVNKAYADALIANSTSITIGVSAATTAPLTSWVYNNGVSGVGATLTAPSNGRLAIDGFLQPVGSLVLNKDDNAGSGAYNGVYIVTNSADGSPAVMQRVDDYDQPENMTYGRIFEVENGTINGGSLFFQTTRVVNTVGTDPINYQLQYSPSFFPLLGTGVTNRLAVFTDTETVGTTGANTLVSLLSPIEYEAGQSTSVSTYTTGTISQSGTTVTGSGTTFTAAMKGAILLPATGKNVLVTGFVSATQLTVSTSQTIPAGTTYRINYGGNLVDYRGNTSIDNLYSRSLRLVATNGSDIQLTASATHPNPFSGPNLLTAQLGAVIAGNKARWSATGLLEDGGSPTFTSITVLTSLTSASFTKNASATRMWLRAVGGGAAGGGSSAGADSTCGSGGGAGMYVEYAGPAANFTYQCGAAGTGTVGSFGGSGGNTTITGLPGGTITAYGGSGGIVQDTSPPFGIGGQGGVGFSGNANCLDVFGESGQYCYAVNATTLISGAGGSSPFGLGGENVLASGSNISLPGIHAYGYGSGGSGAATTLSGAAQAGGSGKPACIVVYQY